MSLGEDIKRESPSTNRRFLIVPLFNPERRHSWGNVVSHLSTRDADVNASVNTVDVESIR